jgi:capsular polysaccharide biosynthesis protein
MNAAKELCMEGGYGRERTLRDPAYFHFGTKSPPRLQGSWTSIISKWVPTDRPQPYAHWLLEALPRLALLEEFPANTGILVPPQKLRYQRESLDLLGLTNRCRGTPERDLVIEDYYFSAPPSMIVCYSPYAVRFLRSKFLPLSTHRPTTPKRFFIRRTTYGRNMVNEQAVLDFFQALGWAIVDTGAIGFMEQIQLFQGAEAICAIHGSGTANMVWCSPGCKFIEIFPDCYLAGDQEWIAQCVDVDYHFMIFPSDYKYDANIDLIVLKEKLRSLKLL